jgi:hypothetical protein
MAKKVVSRSFHLSTMSGTLNATFSSGSTHINITVAPRKPLFLRFLGITATLTASPDALKTYFDSIFTLVDLNKDDFVEASEAVPLFRRSGLANDVLAVVRLHFFWRSSRDLVETFF